MASAQAIDSSASSIVANLYAVVLGRGPDPAGLAFWSAQLASGAPVSAIALALASTAEAHGRRIDPWPSDEAGWLALVGPDSATENADAPCALQSVNEYRVQPKPFLDGTMQASLVREMMLEQARQRQPVPLWVSGYRAFSQADEDGILATILQKLDRQTGTFLEIGASDGLENNTTHLLLQGWSGVWIEADPALVARARRRFRPFIETQRLRVVEAAVTRDNLSDVLDEARLADRVTVLSVDIDGNDHAITRGCLERLTVEVAIVEYNPRFGPLIDWVMPYDSRHTWQQDDWYGASLMAFDLLFREHSLSLVGCNLVGSNAFFVQSEQARTRFDGPFTTQMWYEPARYHLLPAFHCGHPANRDSDRVFQSQVPGKPIVR